MLSVCVKGDGSRFAYRRSGLNEVSQTSHIPNFENWGALALAAWNGNSVDEALRLMGVAPEHNNKRYKFRATADTGMMVYILYALCGLTQREIAFMVGVSDITQRKALKAAGLYIQRDRSGRPVKKKSVEYRIPL